MGTGALTIDAHNVSGVIMNGINAYVGPAGTDLGITSQGQISGTYDGIRAVNMGSVRVDIHVKDVSAADQFAIFAQGYGTDMSITSTGDITSNRTAVVAETHGSGSLNVLVDKVTARDRIAVSMRTYAAGTDLDLIATGAVSGGTGGIQAVNYGTGSTSIIATEVAATAPDSGAVIAIKETNSVTYTFRSAGLLWPEKPV